MFGRFEKNTARKSGQTYHNIDNHHTTFLLDQERHNDNSYNKAGLLATPVFQRNDLRNNINDMNNFGQQNNRFQQGFVNNGRNFNNFGPQNRWCQASNNFSRCGQNNGFVNNFSQGEPNSSQSGERFDRDYRNQQGFNNHYDKQSPRNHSNNSSFSKKRFCEDIRGRSRGDYTNERSPRCSRERIGDRLAHNRSPSSVNRSPSYSKRGDRPIGESSNRSPGYVKKNVHDRLGSSRSPKKRDEIRHRNSPRNNFVEDRRIVERILDEDQLINKACSLAEDILDRRVRNSHGRDSNRENSGERANERCIDNSNNDIDCNFNDSHREGNNQVSRFSRGRGRGSFQGRGRGFRSSNPFTRKPFHSKYRFMRSPSVGRMPQKRSHDISLVMSEKFKKPRMDDGNDMEISSQEKAGDNKTNRQESESRKQDKKLQAHKTKNKHRHLKQRNGLKGNSDGKFKVSDTAAKQMAETPALGKQQGNGSSKENSRIINNTEPLTKSNKHEELLHDSRNEIPNAGDTQNNHKHFSELQHKRDYNRLNTSEHCDKNLPGVFHVPSSVEQQSKPYVEKTSFSIGDTKTSDTDKVCVSADRYKHLTPSSSEKMCSAMDKSKHSSSLLDKVSLSTHSKHSASSSVENSALSTHKSTHSTSSSVENMADKSKHSASLSLEKMVLSSDKRTSSSALPTDKSKQSASSSALSNDKSKYSMSSSIEIKALPSDKKASQLAIQADKSKQLASSSVEKAALCTNRRTSSTTCVANDKSKHSASSTVEKMSLSTDKSKHSASSTVEKMSLSTDKSKHSASLTVEKMSLSTDKSKHSASSTVEKMSLSTDKSQHSVSSTVEKMSLSTDKSKHSVSSTVEKISLSTDKSKHSAFSSVEKVPSSAEKAKEPSSSLIEKASLNTDRNKRSISVDKVSTDKVKSSTPASTEKTSVDKTQTIQETQAQKVAKILNREGETRGILPKCQKLSKSPENSSSMKTDETNAQKISKSSSSKKDAKPNKKSHKHKSDHSSNSKQREHKSGEKQTSAPIRKEKRSKSSSVEKDDVMKKSCNTSKHSDKLVKSSSVEKDLMGELFAVDEPSVSNKPDKNLHVTKIDKKSSSKETSKICSSSSSMSKTSKQSSQSKSMRVSDFDDMLPTIVHKRRERTSPKHVMRDTQKKDTFQKDRIESSSEASDKDVGKSTENETKDHGYEKQTEKSGNNIAADESLSSLENVKVTKSSGNFTRTISTESEPCTKQAEDIRNSETELNKQPYVSIEKLKKLDKLAEKCFSFESSSTKTGHNNISKSSLQKSKDKHEKSKSKKQSSHSSDKHSESAERSPDNESNHKKNDIDTNDVVDGDVPSVGENCLSMESEKIRAKQSKERNFFEDFSFQDPSEKGQETTAAEKHLQKQHVIQSKKTKTNVTFDQSSQDEKASFVTPTNVSSSSKKKDRANKNSDKTPSSNHHEKRKRKHSGKEHHDKSHKRAKGDNPDSSHDLSAHFQVLSGNSTHDSMETSQKTASNSFSEGNIPVPITMSTPIRKQPSTDPEFCDKNNMSANSESQKPTSCDKDNAQGEDRVLTNDLNLSMDDDDPRLVIDFNPPARQLSSDVKTGKENPSCSKAQVEHSVLKELDSTALYEQEPAKESLETSEPLVESGDEIDSREFSNNSSGSSKSIQRSVHSETVSEYDELIDDEFLSKDSSDKIDSTSVKSENNMDMDVLEEPESDSDLETGLNYEHKDKNEDDAHTKDISVKENEKSPVVPNKDQEDHSADTVPINDEQSESKEVSTRKRQTTAPDGLLLPKTEPQEHPQHEQTETTSVDTVHIKQENPEPALQSDTQQRYVDRGNTGDTTPITHNVTSTHNNTLSGDQESEERNLNEDEIDDQVNDENDDEDDIRLMIYDEGIPQNPWTPMPPTPYVGSTSDEEEFEPSSVIPHLESFTEDQASKDSKKSQNDESASPQPESSDSLPAPVPMDTAVITETIQTTTDNVDNAETFVQSISEQLNSTKHSQEEDLDCTQIYSNSTDNVSMSATVEEHASDQLQEDGQCMTPNKNPESNLLPSAAAKKITRSPSVDKVLYLERNVEHTPGRPKSVGDSSNDPFKEQMKLMQNHSASLQNNSSQVTVANLKAVENSSAKKTPLEGSSSSSSELTAEEKAALISVRKSNGELLKFIELQYIHFEQSFFLDFEHVKFYLGNIRFMTKGSFFPARLATQNWKCVVCHSCTKSFSPLGFGFHICPSTPGFENGLQLDEMATFKSTFILRSPNNKVTVPAWKLLKAVQILEYLNGNSVDRTCTISQKILATIVQNTKRTKCPKPVSNGSSQQPPVTVGSVTHSQGFNVDSSSLPVNQGSKLINSQHNPFEDILNAQTMQRACKPSPGSSVSPVVTQGYSGATFEPNMNMLRTGTGHPQRNPLVSSVSQTISQRMAPQGSAVFGLANQSANQGQFSHQQNSSKPNGYSTTVGQHVGGRIWHQTAVNSQQPENFVNSVTGQTIMSANNNYNHNTITASNPFETSPEHAAHNLKDLTSVQRLPGGNQFTNSRPVQSFSANSAPTSSYTQQPRPHPRQNPSQISHTVTQGQSCSYQNANNVQRQHAQAQSSTGPFPTPVDLFVTSMGSVGQQTSQFNGSKVICPARHFEDRNPAITVERQEKQSTPVVSISSTTPWTNPMPDTSSSENMLPVSTTTTSTRSETQISSAPTATVTTTGVATSVNHADTSANDVIRQMEDIMKDFQEGVRRQVSAMGRMQSLVRDTIDIMDRNETRYSEELKKREEKQEQTVLKLKSVLETFKSFVPDH